MNLVCDSAEAKVNICVVFITPCSFARFPVQYLVESLYLPQMMRSHTKSHLYAGSCLVSPYRAPPLGGFCTPGSEDDPGSGWWQPRGWRRWARFPRWMWPFSPYHLSLWRHGHASGQVDSLRLPRLFCIFPPPSRFTRETVMLIGLAGFTLSHSAPHFLFHVGPVPLEL